MVYFFQNLVNALQWGSFYALIALGYSMVYSILMLFNFAHGDIFMVGAYIGFGVATQEVVTIWRFEARCSDIDTRSAVRS